MVLCSGTKGICHSQFSAFLRDNWLGKDRKSFLCRAESSSWSNYFFSSQKWQVWGSVSNEYAVLPQEDISRLRRKLETTKKPDNVPKCDEILMEEIKDYKVRKTASVISLCSFCSGLKWLLIDWEKKYWPCLHEGNQRMASFREGSDTLVLALSGFPACLLP